MGVWKTDMRRVTLNLTIDNNLSEAWEGIHERVRKTDSENLKILTRFSLD